MQIKQNPLRFTTNQKVRGSNPFRVANEIKAPSVFALGAFFALVVIWKFHSKDHKEFVNKTLSGLFLFHGMTEYLRSDSGGKVTANALREWLKRIEILNLAHHGKMAIVRVLMEK